jgi:hypothetical protein
MEVLMQRMIGTALVVVALAFGSHLPATAAASDYVFEAVTIKVPPGDDVQISVRLMNKRTGRAVNDAVIFQTRLDMSPDRMGEMAAEVTLLPANEPGVYRFKADLDMAGRWALKLAAKVPGEQDTVRGDVLIVAAK